MAYTREQAFQVFRARLAAIAAKNAKDKRDQIEKEREERQKVEDTIGILNVAAGAANMSRDWYDRIISSKLDETYGVEGVDELPSTKVLPKKYQWEDISDRGWLPEGFLPGGKKPKLGKIGATVFPPIEERPEYKEFKAIEETGVDPESLTGWINPETGEQGTAQEYAKLVKESQLSWQADELDVGVEVPGVEIPDAIPPLTLSSGKIVKDPSAEFDIDIIRQKLKDNMAATKGLSVSDPEYDILSNEKFELRQQLYYIKTFSPEELEELIQPDVLSPDKSSTILDKELKDMEAGLIDGEEFDLPEGGELTASTDWIPMETPEEVPTEVLPEVEIPDAKPGLVGKVYDTGQTVLQLTNIGKTITDERATDEQKSVASVQGTKLLADLAAKRAGQETVTQLGSKAFSDVLAKKGLKKGLKLTGKQTAGAVLGGALGAHTAVTEFEEAGVSLKEKDYDEAILHGMASGSGALQTGGATMMATGIGVPLGAVLYGIGTAGSVISSTGLFLEGLFGDKEEKEEAPKPRFSAGRYLDSIRRERQYF